MIAPCRHMMTWTDLKSRLDQAGYVASNELAMAIHIALQLERPILLEGDAGVAFKENRAFQLQGDMDRHGEFIGRHIASLIEAGFQICPGHHMAAGGNHPLPVLLSVLLSRADQGFRLSSRSANGHAACGTGSDQRP